MLNVPASDYFTDLELFRMISMGDSGPLWRESARVNQAADKIEPMPGDPGTSERIEHYGRLAELEQPLG